jgi:hypothetical protein
MITEDFTSRIEMFSSIKAKLEVAELVLKALKIEYEIVPSKTHTPKLKKLMYQAPLTQVNDILASLNYGSRIFAERIKKDFEARKYWRKQFQKFQGFRKFQSSN